MLEIRVNLYSQITIRESDETTGIETVWNFNVLQKYIKENNIPKNIVSHLAKYAMKEVQAISLIQFTPEDMDRLEKDLLRALYRLYYTSEMRDYRIEIDEGYFKIYEGETFLKSITVLRFERDLKLEKDKKKKEIVEPVDVAKSCINFVLEGRTLTEAETNRLADDMVNVYNVWRAEEDERLLQLEELKKRNKK